MLSYTRSGDLDTKDSTEGEKNAINKMLIKCGPKNEFLSTSFQS